jgi:hypothetical protein
MKGPVMVNQSTLPRPNTGRFVKGQSGNPKGRPKGSTSHNSELRRAEEDALKLASNVADAIAKTARWALTEIELPELIPLFDTITDVAKKAVRDGEIGPSPLAMLRPAYDDFMDNQKGDFFLHIGLPVDCDWKTFEKHYRTRGRIDFDRFLGDFQSYPPIVQRMAELRAEQLLIPAVADPPNKLKIGFD